MYENIICCTVYLRFSKGRLCSERITKDSCSCYVGGGAGPADPAGECLTNVLIEIASPTIFACRWEARLSSVSCGDPRTSRFECGSHTLSAGVALNTIRLNTKQNSERRACVAPFTRFPRPPMDRHEVNLLSESCYHAKTKAKMFWAPK